MQKDVGRLYANLMPFYVTNLSIYRFWCPWAYPRTNSLADPEGNLYLIGRLRSCLEFKSINITYNGKLIHTTLCAL